MNQTEAPNSQQYSQKKLQEPNDLLLVKNSNGLYNEPYSNHQDSSAAIDIRIMNKHNGEPDYQVVHSPSSKEKHEALRAKEAAKNKDIYSHK